MQSSLTKEAMQQLGFLWSLLSLNPATRYFEEYQLIMVTEVKI